MKKCHIITAYIEGNLTELLLSDASNFIICADGGYEIALSNGINPHLVIGDADSGVMSAIHKNDAEPKPGNANFRMPEFIYFEPQKDVSDTFLCVKHAINLGFESIEIIGGIGGRFDHTISNIQTIAHFSSQAKTITMIDEKNFITVVENSSVSLQPKAGFSISLFSISDICSGINTTGLQYSLKNATLKNSYPLGLSNEFTDAEATIEVTQGKLLVIMSQN